MGEKQAGGWERSGMRVCLQCDPPTRTAILRPGHLSQRSSAPCPHGVLLRPPATAWSGLGRVQWAAWSLLAADDVAGISHGRRRDCAASSHRSRPSPSSEREEARVPHTTKHRGRGRVSSAFRPTGAVRDAVRTPTLKAPTPGVTSASPSDSLPPICRVDVSRRGRAWADRCSGARGQGKPRHHPSSLSPKQS